MSKATKKKHVSREVLEDFVVPTAEQKIVRVVCGRGNNLHEVEATSGEHFLASMPSKFRRNIWIKRGDYVVVNPIAEGHKVQAEIGHILYPQQIKHLKQEKLWPQQFQDQKPMKELQPSGSGGGATQPAGSSTSSSSEDDDLFVNTNRPPPVQYEHSSSSESECKDHSHALS